MIESKIDATDRLRHEGRWAEASVWRDEKRKQLRTDGQTKAGSNEESWDAMLKQFPRLPPSEYAPAAGSSTDGLELVETSPGDHDGPTDLVRDALWVYENLARKGVEAKDAPSLGAWSLLGWARRSQDRFFEQTLPKVMVIEEKRPTCEEVEEEEEVDNEAVQRMLELLRGGKVA